MKRALQGVALLCLALAATKGFAQVWPNRAITLVVPTPAGSGPDVLARIIGQKLSQRIGQPVVVDNKAGASGNIGANAVARSAADGYTLMVTINNFVITPALYKDLPYDPVKDFTAVSKIAVGNLALVVNPKVLPVQNLAELAAYAKARPGQLNYGSPGNGSPIHLAVELLKQQLGLNIVHVPYKSMGGFMNDLLGGQVQLSVIPVHTALPLSRAGRLNVIAVSGEQRSVLAPESPSFGEAGLKNVDIELYFWIAGPARLPREIVVRLNQEVVAILADADVREALLKQGMVPGPSTPEAIGTLIRTDVARWKKFISDNNITAD